MTGNKIDVVAGDSFSLNGIDRTEKIEDLHLLQSDGQYVLELRAGRANQGIAAGRPQFQAPRLSRHRGPCSKPTQGAASRSAHSPTSPR